TGYRQWISLAITYDPGQLPALLAAIAALAGLLVSFLVRRRRVFVRAVPGPGGGATVEFGGLARTESSETLGAEFEGLSKDLSAALAVPTGTVPAAGGLASSGSPAPSEASASPDLPSSPDERE